MIRLVVNDVRLNIVWLFWIFLLLNLRIAWAMAPFANHYAGVKAGVAFAMLMPLIVLLREEYYRNQNVLRSIPVRPDHVVYAKYISVILLGIAPALYGWSYQQLIEHLGPHGSLSYYARQLETGYSVEHSLIARAIGCTAVVAIGMPLIIRFGSFWGILLPFLALQIVWGRIVDFLLALSLHVSWFLGMSRWMFFAIVSMGIVLILSCKLSVWLYGRREL